jgi:hypothetical protein
VGDAGASGSRPVIPVVDSGRLPLAAAKWLGTAGEV